MTLRRFDNEDTRPPPALVARQPRAREYIREHMPHAGAGGAAVARARARFGSSCASWRSAAKDDAELLFGERAAWSAPRLAILRRQPVGAQLHTAACPAALLPVAPCGDVADSDWGGVRADALPVGTIREPRWPP